MKIVLATPLYPPDLAEPAPYIKELARRLAPHHEVTVITYGRLPEQVPGVRIIAVDKRVPLPTRLWAYLRALRHAAYGADVVYAQNGPSVELPLLFVRGQKVFHIADERAHAYAAHHPLRRTLEWLASRNAPVVTGTPPQRPEILPFVPHPDAALAAWEQAWSSHIENLVRTFNAH